MNHNFQLLNNILYFPLLVLKGLYHYWTHFLIFFPEVGKNLKEPWEFITTGHIFSFFPGVEKSLPL